MTRRRNQNIKKQERSLEASKEEAVDPELIEEVTKEVVQEVISATRYSGPLPPPELLRGYNEIHPDFADRIFANWEKETAHRHALEEKAVASEIENEKSISSDVVRGQYLAFLLALAFLGVGGFLTYHDKQISGVLFGSAGFIGIVLAFLKTAFKSRDNKNGNGNGKKEPSDEIEK